MHPTGKGYDLMGKLVAERLSELISGTNMSDNGEGFAKTDLKAREATDAEGVSGRVLRSSKHAGKIVS